MRGMMAHICSISAAGLSLPLQAEAKSENFNIPAGDLRAVLIAYARQSGLQVIFQAADLQGVTSPGVVGAMSAERALSRLLAGTRFSAVRDRSGAIAITPVARRKAAGRSQTPPLPAPLARPPESQEVQDILVTAQRRMEKIQQVPISISTLSQGALDRNGATSIADLASIVPGVRILGRGANVVPAIRGVRADPSDPGNDPNVATYVDGVYSPGKGDNTALPDVSRVEILKGPQGTLYGRNATGGAIRIFTVEPRLDRLSLKAEAGLGNYNGHHIKGHVTAPLWKDKVGFLFSGSYERRNGYNVNAIDGRRTHGLDSRTLRAKLRVDPGGDWRIDLFASYARRHDDDITAYAVLGGNSMARPYPDAVIATRPYRFTSTDRTETRTTTRTAGMRFSVDSGIGTFETTAAWYGLKGFSYADADLTNADILSVPFFTRDRNFQQEILFRSVRFGNLQLTAGAFYFKAVGRYDPNITSGLLLGNGVFAARYNFGRQGTEASAAFGELNWEPTSRWSFIAGARLSHERKDAQACACFLTDNPNAIVVRPKTLPSLGEVSFKSLTPRLSVRYRFTGQGDHVYMTYSRGFKSGGFNYIGLQKKPYSPETIDAIELGIKTDPSRVIRASVAAFYYAYSDKQSSAVVNDVAVVTNAAAVEIYGIDIDVAAHFSSKLRMEAGVAFLHAKYKSYTLAPSSVPIVNTDGTPCLCGNRIVNLDLSGQQASNSPKFSASLSTIYSPPVRSGKLNLSATLFYSSQTNIQASPRISIRSYATLALRAEYMPARSPFAFYLWGKNVTDSQYEQNLLIANAGDGVNYAPPATYGGGIRYAF